MILSGDIVSETGERYKFEIIYRLLILLNEKGSMSYSELWESYRERCKQRVNYEIVRRHIDYMERKGLITIEKGKPNLIRVTKKGLDYVFLVSRIEALLGESISC